MDVCPNCRADQVVGYWEQVIDRMIAVWWCRACGKTYPVIDNRLEKGLNVEENKRLAAALEYVAMGFFVLPLTPGKKWIDHDTAEATGFDWLSEIKPTADDVTRWFEAIPDLNIGIRLKESGLTVIDVDKLEAWDSWRGQHETFMPVPTVQTGRGKHYYFLAGEDEISGTLYHGDEYIADFLTPTPPEWKSYHKAYVVAPPSTHPLGQEYEWLVSLKALGKTAPDWVRDAVRVPEAPHSWLDYDEDDPYYDDEPGYHLDYDEYEPDPERDEIEALVQEKLEARYPDGLPDNFDWGGLYQEVDEELARRAMEADTTFGDHDPTEPPIDVSSDSDELPPLPF